MECWFRCRLNGLTGEQGVLIPESNVPNLMLKEEVVQAVKENQFHIWAVSHIDEGISILTGVKAGALREDGTFEEGSVNERVDAKIEKLARQLKAFGSATHMEKNG